MKEKARYLLLPDSNTESESGQKEVLNFGNIIVLDLRLLRRLHL